MSPGTARLDAGSLHHPEAPAERAPAEPVAGELGGSCPVRAGIADIGQPPSPSGAGSWRGFRGTVRGETCSPGAESTTPRAGSCTAGTPQRGHLMCKGPKHLSTVSPSF